MKKLLTLIVVIILMLPKDVSALRPVATVLSAEDLGFSPIDEKLVVKWRRILSDELERVKKGGRRIYPFSFGALCTLLGTLNELPKIEGDLYTTGVRLSEVRDDFGSRMASWTKLGIPQEFVEARFLVIKSKKLLSYSIHGLFEAADAVVPFIGSFYKPNGSGVSDEELAKIGLEWLKDDKGEYIRIPVFVIQNTPSRISNFFLGGSHFMQILMEDGEFRIFATIEDYEEFISRRFGNDRLPQLRKTADDVTQQHYAKKIDSTSDLYREMRELNYFLEMRKFLSEQECKTGYFKILTIRYKGFGGKYECQIVNREDLEKGTIPSSQRAHPKFGEKDKYPDIAAVEDTRFKGKSGIILTEYQSSNVAIGGSSDEELEALRRDREMFNNGAVLSAFNIDVVEIANEEKLRAIGASSDLRPLFGSISVVLDDTRSLVEVLHCHSYEYFLEEEFNGDIEKAKDTHISEFCKNLAENIAAALKCGLSIDMRDVATDSFAGIARNVSPSGRLRDTGDLVPINIPQEAMIIVKSAFDSILYLTRKAGMSFKDFIRSEYFDLFTQTLIISVGGSDEERQDCLTRLETLKKTMLDAKTETEAEAYVWLAPVIRLIFNHWVAVSGIKDVKQREGDFFRYIYGNIGLHILASSEVIMANLENFLKESREEAIELIQAYIILFGLEAAPLDTPKKRGAHTAFSTAA